MFLFSFSPPVAGFFGPDDENVEVGGGHGLIRFTPLGQWIMNGYRAGYLDLIFRVCGCLLRIHSQAVLR